MQVPAVSTSTFITAKPCCLLSRRRCLHRYVCMTEKDDAQKPYLLRVGDVQRCMKELHPTLQVLKQRMESGSRPGRRKDPYKVGLAIEGGGMRGILSAGMCAAIKYSGYADVFDCVYGSSAGAIVGAYFVSRQLPLYGARVYFDDIPSDKYISIWALRSHPYFRPFANPGNKLFYTQTSRPVLHLDALLQTIVLNRRPLHYPSFAAGHKQQPLFPIASCLTSMTSKALPHESLSTLVNALRASARVPGIAGPAVIIDGKPYADAWMFEPIPYRTAIADGCTHVLVLRSRAESGEEARIGVYERHIAAPYFSMDRHTAKTGAADFILSGGHIDAYRDAVEGLERGRKEPIGGNAWVLQVLPGSEAREVGQLETRGRVLNEGCRVGFAAAYEMLSPCGAQDAGMIEEEWVSVLDGGRVEKVTERRKKAKGRRRIRRMTIGDKVARWVFNEDDAGRGNRRKESVEKVNFAKWTYFDGRLVQKRKFRNQARRRLRRMKLKKTDSTLTVEEPIFGTDL